MPKYVHYKKLVSKEDMRHGCFGVVLNSTTLDDLNNKLVVLANEIAKRYGLKFYLKYHPQHEYYSQDKLADPEYFPGHLPLKMPVDEYAQMVDFALISNSSVYIELIYLGCRVYRMNSGDEDKFRDVPLNAFTDIEDFAKLYESASEDTDSELFDYLCFTHEPESYHSAFFNSFASLKEKVRKIVQTAVKSYNSPNFLLDC